MTEIRMGIPTAAANELIRIHDTMSEKAMDLAKACVEILINEYRANETTIDTSIFYYQALGQQLGEVMDGKQPMSPAEMVSAAVNTYWEYLLGLAEPTKTQQDRISKNRSEIGWRQGKEEQVI